jgi:hypothetical protein
MFYTKHTTGVAILQGEARREVLHPPVAVPPLGETRGHSDFNFGKATDQSRSPKSCLTYGMRTEMLGKGVRRR